MPFLEGKELAQLLVVLRDSKGSLESVAASFHKSFPKADVFKIGATITILLQDGLLTRTERIVAFYILCDLFRNVSSDTNPFLPVFLEALERDSTQACEKRFLKHLILSTQQSSRDAAKKSASDLIAESELDLAVDIPDLEALRNLYLERTPHVPGFRGIGVRPIVADPASSTAGVGGSGGGSVSGGGGSGSGGGGEAFGKPAVAAPPESLSMEDVLKYEVAASDGRGLSLISFEPEFLRPPPPLFDGAGDEVMWLNPEPKSSSSCMWDFTMCEDTSRYAEVAAIARACILRAISISSPVPSRGLDQGWEP